MRISFSSTNLNRTQSINNGCCGSKKPVFQSKKNTNEVNQPIDYKKEYQKTKNQLDYMSKKYEVLCNVCALSMNPKLK